MSWSPDGKGIAFSALAWASRRSSWRRAMGAKPRWRSPTAPRIGTYRRGRRWRLDRVPREGPGWHSDTVEASEPGRHGCPGGHHGDRSGRLSVEAALGHRTYPTVLLVRPRPWERELGVHRSRRGAQERAVDRRSRRVGRLRPPVVTGRHAACHPDQGRRRDRRRLRRHRALRRAPAQIGAGRCLLGRLGARRHSPVWRIARRLRRSRRDPAVGSGCRDTLPGSTSGIASWQPLP